MKCALKLGSPVYLSLWSLLKPQSGLNVYSWQQRKGIQKTVQVEFVFLPFLFCALGQFTNQNILRNSALQRRNQMGST